MPSKLNMKALVQIRDSPLYSFCCFALCSQGTDTLTWTLGKKVKESIRKVTGQTAEQQQQSMKASTFIVPHNILLFKLESDGFDW